MNKGKRAGPRRKALALLLALVLSFGLCALPGAAKEQLIPGDVNGDGKVTLLDVTLLKRWLSPDWEQEIVVGNGDVNGDERTDEEDVRDLQLWLVGDWAPASAPGLPEDLAAYTLLTSGQTEVGADVCSFRYGSSALGRDLVCWCLTAGDWDRTVLLNFEIHGFEDAYDRDGQLLVDLGEAVADHFANRPDLLCGCRLLIIPSANPDGLAEGSTNNGFGRCNAEGIDLNRDFDANHTPYTDPRNATAAPFSAVESRAMRDLVLRSHPAVVMDLHGWENCTLGNSGLAECFSLHAGLHQRRELTEAAHGYFSYWAQLQGAEALLVEFASPNSIPQEGVFTALEEVLAGNYGPDGGPWTPDAELAAFADVTAWTLGTGNIDVFRQVGDTASGYGFISGAEDQCVIRRFYDNGWCKVLYPAGGNTKTGYCPAAVFLDTEHRVSPRSGSVSADKDVFADPGLSRRIGSVWTTDSFTVVAEREDTLQIIYPLDSGGWKLGWISGD